MLVAGALVLFLWQTLARSARRGRRGTTTRTP
jgi:hypothetical protein